MLTTPDMDPEFCTRSASGSDWLPGLKGYRLQGREADFRRDYATSYLPEAHVRIRSEEDCPGQRCARVRSRAIADPANPGNGRAWAANIQATRFHPAARSGFRRPASR